MYIVISKENQYSFIVSRNIVIGIALRLRNDRYKRRSPFFVKQLIITFKYAELLVLTCDLYSELYLDEFKLYYLLYVLFT